MGSVSPHVEQVRKLCDPQGNSKTIRVIEAARPDGKAVRVSTNGTGYTMKLAEILRRKGYRVVHNPFTDAKVLHAYPPK